MTFFREFLISCSSLIDKFVIFSGIFSALCFAQPATSTFDGRAALEYTRRAVSFGERPSGSDALQHCREWMISQLKPLGGQIMLDSFSGQTPNGPIPMVNVILKFPGSSGQAVAITGHYDTKRISMVHFVGANDGGSSTGFLIEMSRVFAKQKHSDDLYVVFFDGEEALGQWSQSDSVYGSRHLAAKWGAEGVLSKLKALINVDMIGDRDLDIMNDANSSQSLHQLIWGTAEKLGDGKYFKKEQGGADDDHMPFVDAGVNAADLLDLDYGPNSSFWHTDKDTMDKLSAHSLQVVGDVLLAVVEKLA